MTMDIEIDLMGDRLELANKLAELLVKINALEASLSMMHRRAQREEGAAARLNRVQDAAQREIAKLTADLQTQRDCYCQARDRAHHYWNLLARIPRWIRRLFGAV